MYSSHSYWFRIALVLLVTLVVGVLGYVLATLATWVGYRETARLQALYRCLYYGLMPWPVELCLYGYVHYTRRDLGYGPGRWLWISWKNIRHCYDNLAEAWKLLTYKELSAEEQAFHKLED